MEKGKARETGVKGGAGGEYKADVFMGGGDQRVDSGGGGWKGSGVGMREVLSV